MYVWFRCGPHSAEASWGAVPQHPQRVRHHRSQGSVSWRWAWKRFNCKNSRTAGILTLFASNSTCIHPPHSAAASRQVRLVWPAPAASSTLRWWVSQQQSAPVRLWPSASCSSYWELAHMSRGAQTPPANLSRVLPRQLSTPLMWVVVSSQYKRASCHLEIIFAAVAVKYFFHFPFSEQVSAFNVSYSDSGLFGIYTISQAASAGDVSVSWWQEAVHQYSELSM